MKTIVRWTSRWIDPLLWTAAAGLTVLAFVLSLMPGEDLGPQIVGIDKVYHALGYGAICLSLLLVVAWRPGRGPGRFPHTAVRIVLGVILLGWLIELLQWPFGRDPSVWDALADVVGVLAAAFIWRQVAVFR